MTPEEAQQIIDQMPSRHHRTPTDHTQLVEALEVLNQGEENDAPASN